MLVCMEDSGAIQFAAKAMQNSEVCGVCKTTIHLNEYYTRHQAPDPRRRNRLTGKTPMVPYNACETCAPFIRLESHTGEISLAEVLNRAKAAMQETRIMPAVVRTSTPPPTSGPLPDEGPITPRPHRAIRPIRLVEDNSWLK